MTMETVLAEQSSDNMRYVRRLLGQRQPGFAAALEVAVIRAEREQASPELSRDISAVERS
jgi:hypothetical protein